MSTFGDRFWERVYRNELLLRYFFVIDVLFLLLALAAYPAVEPGSAAHVLVVLDLAIFVGFLVPLVYMLYRCRLRRIEDQQL